MEDEKGRKIKSVLQETALYFAVFVIIFIAYLVFKPLYTVINRNGIVSQTIIALSALVIISVGFYLKQKNKLTYRNIIILLIIFGFILRLGYMLYTPFGVRQHDTFTSAHDGHYDYAYLMYSEWKLPDTNDYQFYHPPLNPFIQAVFMHVYHFVARGLNSIFHTQYVLEGYELFGSAQILATLYSFVTMIVAIKTFKLLNIKDFGLVIACALICLFPRFIQLSGQLNNDMLTIMFCFMAMYYTVKWWKNKSFLNIILLALSIGLAMASKLSGATICLTTAVVFILEFVKTIKTKKAKDIVLICSQFVVFLMICAPIGLWFQVYAKIRFNQSFGHVFSNLNSELYVGDQNFFWRFFFIIPIDELFDSIFCLPFKNYNLFNYAIRSSLFGEFNYWQAESFAVVSIVLAYLAILVIFIGTIIYFRNSHKEDFDKKLIFSTLFIGQVFSFVYFNIQMPYGCTMDFRYVVPITLSIAGFAALADNKLASIEKFKKYLPYYRFIIFAFLVSISLFYTVAI